MLIPDKIGTSESIGEQIVFNKFREEKDYAFVLHSVFLHKHLSQVCGEIDFLVIMPGHGVFALEVKHGPVSREGGMWRYKDTYKKKSPYSQASGAIHSLRKWLLDNASAEKRSEIGNWVFGYGVIFSGISSPIPLGTEGEQWQTLYRNELINFSMQSFMNNLSERWHEKMQEKPWYAEEMSRPGTKDCEFLVKLIRGDFSRNYSFLNKIADENRLIQSFTEQQFTILDHLKYNERGVIEGFAGTGKTLIALELFHQNLQKGISSCFICFNKDLATNLKKRTELALGQPLPEGFYIGTFHSLITELLGIDTYEAHEPKYYKEVLPFEYLLNAEEGTTKSQIFEYLIVDEAQDLVTENYLLVMDLLLQGGLKNGKWTMFGDFYFQNLYTRHNGIELLKVHSHFARFQPLKVNCRNSEKISFQNTLISGVRYEKNDDVVIKGEPVDLKFLPQMEIAAYLEKVIRDYKNKKVPLGKITVLGRKKAENTTVFNNNYLKGLIKGGSLEYRTIFSFKGLENDIVILIWDDMALDEDKVPLLYTAISRARIFLHMIINDDVKKSFFELTNKNMLS